jgi:hypothetical protein
MRLPNTAHISRPWRIHELTPDFRVKDVWALPTPGGPDVGDGSHGMVSRVSRTLFAHRSKLGELLGWDDPAAGVGRRMSTLRARLPADLRDGPRGPDPGATPMTRLSL